jgi:hypothetical protein
MHAYFLYDEGMQRRKRDAFTVMTIGKMGERSWRYNGRLHKEFDMPALIFQGEKTWFYFGKWHRENDMPAAEMLDKQLWYYKGQLHRDGDKPACVYKNGTLGWFAHGTQARTGGLPIWEWADGTKRWSYVDRCDTVRPDGSRFSRQHPTPGYCFCDTDLAKMTEK